MKWTILGLIMACAGNLLAIISLDLRVRKLERETKCHDRQTH